MQPFPVPIRIAQRRPCSLWRDRIDEGSRAGKGVQYAYRAMPPCRWLALQRCNSPSLQAGLHDIPAISFTFLAWVLLPSSAIQAICME